LLLVFGGRSDFHMYCVFHRERVPRLGDGVVRRAVVATTGDAIGLYSRPTPGKSHGRSARINMD
jgi:hypothetical protein